MVRRTLILLALLWATTAQASIVERCAPVFAGNSGSTALSVSATLCSNIQASDLIYAGCEAAGSQTPGTPTDGVGNTFALITGGNQVNGAEKLYHFTKTAVAGDAGATLSCAVGVATFIELQVRVFYSTDGSTPQIGSTNFATATSVGSITYPSTNAPTKSGSLFLLVQRENAGNADGWSAGVIDRQQGGGTFGTASAYFGCAGTTFPGTMPSFTGAAGGNWMYATIEIQTSNGSSAGAVLTSAGLVETGNGGSQVLTPGPQCQNNDTELACLTINSGSPGFGAPAGWTLLKSISNTNLSSTLAAWSHIKSGGDGATWTWTNTATTNNAGFITCGGNINTTTPVDVSSAMTWNQGSLYLAPAVQPTANDEMLMRCVSTPHASAIAYPTPPPILITGINQGQLALEGVYSDVSANNTAYLAGAGVVSNAANGITLSLQSAATPTRPTANQRVDQLGLMTLTPFGAPEPPPSCGNCGMGVGAP